MSRFLAGEECKIRQSFFSSEKTPYLCEVYIPPWSDVMTTLTHSCRPSLYKPSIICLMLSSTSSKALCTCITQQGHSASHGSLKQDSLIVLLILRIRLHASLDPQNQEPTTFLASVYVFHMWLTQSELGPPSWPAESTRLKYRVMKSG